MTTCKEYRDDVMAITAIPVSKISSAVPTSPVLALTPTITYDFSQHFDADTIVIGLQKAIKTTIIETPVVQEEQEEQEEQTTVTTSTETSVGSLIPIVRATGKAKDEEGDSVPGRLHTVTVTCQVDDRDSSVWNNLLTLERTPSHLLLTFRDNTRAFVAATQDTYIFKTNRDGSKTTATFRIENIMGIQLVN